MTWIYSFPAHREHCAPCVDNAFNYFFAGRCQIRAFITPERARAQIRRVSLCAASIIGKVSLRACTHFHSHARAACVLTARVTIDHHHHHNSAHNSHANHHNHHNNRNPPSSRRARRLSAAAVDESNPKRVTIAERTQMRTRRCPKIEISRTHLSIGGRCAGTSVHACICMQACVTSADTRANTMLPLIGRSISSVRYLLAFARVFITLLHACQRRRRNRGPFVVLRGQCRHALAPSNTMPPWFGLQIYRAINDDDNDDAHLV